MYCFSSFRKSQEDMMKTMGELKDEKDRLERETRTRRQLETALKVTKQKIKQSATVQGLMYRLK